MYYSIPHKFYLLKVACNGVYAPTRVHFRRPRHDGAELYLRTAINTFCYTLVRVLHAREMGYDKALEAYVAFGIRYADDGRDDICPGNYQSYRNIARSVSKTSILISSHN